MSAGITDCEPAAQPGQKTAQLRPSTTGRHPFGIEANQQGFTLFSCRQQSHTVSVHRFGYDLELQIADRADAEGSGCAYGCPSSNDLEQAA